MNGLSKFFPTPSDKMGTLWALSSIKDACIIEYGPGGTTHYSMEGIFKINGEISASTYTTHISEDDVVMGDTERLRKTILEVDEVYKPKYIFVIASSLISVIGTDIQGVVYELTPQVNAKLIVYQSGGFKGDYTVGMAQVLSDLAVQVVQPCSVKEERSYNLLGCGIDDYRYAANIKAIQTVLRESLGLHCKSVWTAESSIDEIEASSTAALNIVMRQEAFTCAELLKEHFGTPHIYAHPIGYTATIEMIEAAAEALGLVPDATYMETAKKKMRRVTMSVKSRLRQMQDKSLVLSGGYDAVRAYERFLCDDLGFALKCALINHMKTAENASEHYKFNVTEGDKESAAAENPMLLVGDAVLLQYAKNTPFTLQIQNPNIDKIIITAHKSFMCFDGADDIAEKLMNGT